MCARTLLALLLLTASAGCDRRLEPWIDKAEEPPVAERPVQIPGLSAPIVRSQPRSGLAPVPAAMASTRGAGAAIRGTLRLDDEEELRPGGVLFLIARTSETGPPLAVQRLPVGPFPMDFEIGSRDVMIPGLAFAGKIRLTARVDADGDPLTTDARELSGRLMTAVEPGASGVQLVLRTDSE